MLPDYLWGIETSPLSRRGTQLRFQTTYEELKLGFQTIPYTIRKSFQTTYEELKHALIRSNVSFSIASRLPMRNWNRGQVGRYQDGKRFQTTYEELKRSFLFSEYQLSCSASRLPMRNWNVPVPIISPPSHLASRLPMRNWNISFTAKESRMKRASRLPMRNWNLTEARMMPSISLPDYLWGIETVETTRRGGNLYGFQTTYEELKQTTGGGGRQTSALASRLPMRNWNLNPNKEVWRMLGFQTTYEELKPPFWLAVWFATSASRLPMRNWNREFFRCLDRIFLLPDYLWGIETISFPKTWSHYNTASRLPMRNWNTASATSAIWLLSCFQTTYEELKHRSQVEGVFRVLLPDYLWGIETF